MSGRPGSLDQAESATFFFSPTRPRTLAAVLLLFLALLGGCAAEPTRLLPSGLNSTFSGDQDQPYSEYIEHYREIIEAGRLDLTAANRAQVVAANLPFELRPDPDKFPPGPEVRWPRGIILLHGLTDSPYIMQAEAEYFRSRGWLVRGILLPGHGTRPGDLTRVRMEDWQAALDYAVALTGTRVKRLYLGGFSLGGTLALDYTLDNPNRISGLFLFSPCLRVKSSLSWLAPILGFFKTWLEVHADSDYAKYESFAINGGVQVLRLTDRLESRARRYPERLKLPVFAALSLEDETVDSRYTLDFFHRYLNHPANRLLLYSAERAPELPPDRRITVVESFIPVRKILSLSHLAITVPPEDPHYGENGDYRNCLHYHEDSSEFKLCRAGKARWLGEKTPANLESGLLQRLTWNPRFSLQEEEQDRFVAVLN